MHVGHIRSTILGDSLARTLRLLGHRVITDNHLGDWGTQFGMLLVGWKTLLDAASLQADPLAEMERIYKTVSAQCDPEKPGFDQATLDRARAELVKLQARRRGEPGDLARDDSPLPSPVRNHLWPAGSEIRPHPGRELLPSAPPGRRGRTDAAAASPPRAAAPSAILSDGSVPPKDDPFLIHKEGEWIPNPFIIQKSDGGFNYATTDLATLAYRIETWHADEIIYVTDGRQQLHFRQLFAAFRRWHPEAKVKLAHVWFGSILGEDGKPFKTRSGETIRLAELLDEAEERAFKLVSEKSPDLPEADRREIARVVGISRGQIRRPAAQPPERLRVQLGQAAGVERQHRPVSAIRLRPHPQHLPQGQRGQGDRLSPLRSRSRSRSPACSLDAPEELALARHLLNFGLVLEAVAEDYRPNFLCNYLYELAGHFTGFYENCPVLKSEPEQRASRLVLCDLTARVLKQGLDVLGIETLEQM